jgi:hypothetical protein
MSSYCSICDNTYSSEFGLKQHYGRTHDDKENPYKEERVCKQCEDIFYINVAEMKRNKTTGEFCSSDCQGKYEKNGEKIECKNCENLFYLSKSRLNERNSYFCSKDCRSEYNTTSKTCKYCEESFRIWKSEDNRDRNSGKYCSKMCRYNDGRSSYTCDNCGTVFEYVKSNRTGDKKFCSLSCYGEYKLESGDIRKKSKYNKWVTSVKERDGYTCVDCGSKNNLHAHHIIPISEDASEAFDLDNGITVCKDCHADRHEQRGEHVAELIRNHYRKS